MTPTLHHPAALDEFDSVSKEHAQALNRRGYDSIVQANLTARHLAKARWKTYWRANHPNFGAVFLKINYGYSPESNRAIGEKEAWLPEYLGAHFRSMPEIEFPRVVDSWPLGNAYAVAFEEAQLESHSLPILVRNRYWRTLLVEFLRTWMAIPPPPWWSSGHVVNDFALHEKLPTEPKGLSPFGFDLDDNICASENRLLFYDMEFIQWSSRGLQQLFLALKLLEARREVMQCMFGRGVAFELIGQVSPAERQPALAQARAAYRAFLDRNHRDDFRSRFAAGCAERLARLRCG